MRSNPIKKIALLRPPATYADWYKNPALGISYICACLEKWGFECKIFNAYSHSWTETELLEHVKEYNPDAVGISAMTHEIKNAAQIATQLKEQLDVPVIIGGCHVTALPKETLIEFPVFDYGIYGEGEKTIYELLKHLQNGTDSNLDKIKGLVFRKEQQVIVNAPRPPLTSQELDELPYPAYHQYYGSDPNALKDKNSYYTILTSRGCPYNCAFCMQVLGRTIRKRSSENICAEIEHAIFTYGAHTINFADEIFLFDSPWTRELLEMLIQKGISKKIKWRGQIRANFVNSELIDLAKRAGCCLLGMGVESGDDEILQTVGKNLTIEQIKRAVKLIKDAKIPLGTYYILGHPNETLETVKKTVDLAVKLNTDTIAVGLMVPYPGTRIFEMAKRGEAGYKLLTQNWSRYDKYYEETLEIEGLSYKELIKWQRKAILNLYLKNFRIIDAMKYFWQRKKAIIFLLKKTLNLVKQKTN